MKPRFFIRLNLILTIVFLIIFVAILYSIDPFQASRFLIIIFYLTLFGLILGILNLLNVGFKIPLWSRILIALTAIAVLILQRRNF